MKVHVPSIPVEGKDFSFNQSEKWFSNLLLERLPESYRPGNPAEVKVHLSRVNDNVTASGNALVVLSPSCSRCAKSFSYPLEISFLWHLAPAFRSSVADKPGEEVELSADDLDFGVYENDEIDLGALAMEEIILSLPIRFLCQERCLGLCLQCGNNLNEKNCRCTPNLSTHPFSALRDFKVKS